MELFTYLMAKNDHNTSVKKDLFSYLLGKNQSGTYQEFTGTSISANNTKKGKMKVNLLGNTSQNTTTGKNLLPNNATSQTINGITFTKNDNGTITANGTATADSVLYLNSSSVTFPAGTYTLNGCHSGGSWETYSMAFGNKNDSGSGNTFTLTESYSSQAYIRIASGYQANHLLFKPMLSTSGGDYEPYTNGASPNPDYPQPINVVSGDNEIKIYGNNLFDTINIVEGEYYNTSGIDVLNPDYIRMTDYVYCYGKSSLTISGASSSYAQLIFYDNSKNVVDYWGVRDRTITIPNNAYYFRASCLKNEKNSVMINYGTTALAYEPYTSTSYTIHLGVENLFDYDNTTFNNNSTGTTTKTSEYVKAIPNTTSNYSGFYVPTLPNITTTSLSFKAKADSSRTINVAYFNKSTTITLTTEWQTFKIENATYNTNTLDFYSGSDHSGVAFYVKDIQIEKGSKANSYSAYGTTPIELCKIGDYKDRFFKNIPNTIDYKSDLEDNEWYLEKKIGKRDLGLLNWIPVNNSADSRTQGLFTCFGFTEIVNYGYDVMPDILSNKYTPRTSYKYLTPGRNPDDYTCATYNGSIAYIQNSSFSDYTNEQVKEALNGTLLYYPLAIPTYTPITATLKDELEAVWRANSYKGTTNISQVNNDLPFNLDVEIKVGN